MLLKLMSLFDVQQIFANKQNKGLLFSLLFGNYHFLLYLVHFARVEFYGCSLLRRQVILVQAVAFDLYKELTSPIVVVD